MFYTSVHSHFNSLLVSGYKNNARIRYKTDGRDMKPCLYHTSDTRKGTAKTLDGVVLNELSFKNIEDYIGFKKNYDDMFSLYGDFSLPNQYITRMKLADDIDPNLLRICYLDIETETKFGFPQINNPKEKINVITVYSTQDKLYHTFCLTPKPFSIDREDVVLQCFEKEIDLLKAFLLFWKDADPDIISGWNSMYFDIPYLYERIAKVLSVGVAKHLSPFQVAKSRVISRGSREETIVDILGLAHLDYLELYKKYNGVVQENYRLDHIANVELKERKLDYSHYETLMEFYTKDFPNFVLYNITDVELIVKLEKKRKLIDLATTIAYIAKENFEDIYSPIRTWDSICYNYLYEQNIMIPSYLVGKKEEQFIGAFVKDPVNGLFPWVCSFDVTSLYPSIIRMLNISPETLITKEVSPVQAKNLIESLLNGQMVDFTLHKENQWSLSAAGQFYKKEPTGFIPFLLGTLFERRIQAKNQLKDVEKQLEKDRDNEELEMLSSTFSTRQQAFKILLNSLYGAFGSPYFRFYNLKNAESVTLTGQYIIKTITQDMNEFLNKIFKTQGNDYCVISDTDSIYLSLGKIFEIVNQPFTLQERVDFMNEFIASKIIPTIKKSIVKIECAINAIPGLLSMARENISESTIVTGKKHYIMDVIEDDKGVRYLDKRKKKIVGIEAVRSSTPPICKELVKDTIDRIFTHTNDEVIDFIDTCKQKVFDEPNIDLLAFPRSVNDSEAYEVNDEPITSGLESFGVTTKSEFKKGTPIHVKAAFVYNKFIQDNKLTDRYATIKNGDKIKFVYLKDPNPLHEKVVAWCSSTCPKELRLDKYIDREMQFKVGYMNAVSNILNAISWKTEKEHNLMDWF